MNSSICLVIGMAAVVLVGCGQSSKTTPVVPADRVTSLPQTSPVTATMAYWNGLNSLPGQIAPDMKGGPQDQIKALRSAAQIIRHNPTLGVDPELTDWAQRMATLLQQHADLIEQSRSPALLAEAFLRGTQGDPFGAGHEMNQAERAWLANYRAVTREQLLLRARLTARYNVEFPHP